MPRNIWLLMLAAFLFVAPVAWTMAAFTIGRAAGYVECRTARDGGSRAAGSNR